MTSPIRTERHGEVLVIISDNPPVNALGAAVRQGLEAAIKEGVADATVEALAHRGAECVDRRIVGYDDEHLAMAFGADR